MAKRSSTTRASAQIWTLPTGGEIKLLQIDIDCGACGEIHYVIHGHHLKAIAHAILGFLTEHPDASDAEEIKTITTLNIQGRPPEDPTRN